MEAARRNREERNEDEGDKIEEKTNNENSESKKLSVEGQASGPVSVASAAGLAVALTLGQEAVIRDNKTKPIRVVNQVPIMHSPGEVAQVASLYDSRIFDEPNYGSEPNIEFHIHAFLNPNANAAGAAARNAQQANRSRSPSAQNDAARAARPAQPQRQEVAVGPDGNQPEQLEQSPEARRRLSGPA